MYIQLCVGVLYFFVLFHHVLLSVLSRVAIILTRKRDLVALPCGVMGWSAMYDCGIS